MAFSPQPANNNPCPGHADGFKTLIMPMRDEVNRPGSTGDKFA
jgi:hypothetical protein